METILPITIEETNIEVLAKIIKAECEKLDCTLNIDFKNGHREIEYVGEEEYRSHIAQQVFDIFKPSKSE
jgi:hypothetical protein